MRGDDIIEYGMAAHDNHFALAGLVNEQIQQGFQPYGKPFLKIHGEVELLCQPMVKYGVKKKTKKQSITK